MYVLCAQVVNITVRQPELRDVTGVRLQEKANDGIKALRQKGRWEAKPERENNHGDGDLQSIAKPIHESLKAELGDLAAGKGFAGA